MKLANLSVLGTLPQVLNYLNDGHGKRQGDNKSQDSGKVRPENTEHYYERWINIHLRTLNFGHKQVVLKQLNHQVTQSHQDGLFRSHRQRNQDTKATSNLI